MSTIIGTQIANYGNFYHNIGVADGVTYVFYSDTSDWGDTPYGNELSYKDSSDNFTAKKQITVPGHGAAVFHHYHVGLAQGDDAFYVFAVYNDAPDLESWCIKFSSSGIEPKQIPFVYPGGGSGYLVAQWAFDFTGSGIILLSGGGGYLWDYAKYSYVYDFDINTITEIPSGITGLENYQGQIVPTFRYPFYDPKKNVIYTAFVGLDPTNASEAPYELTYYLIGFDCETYQFFAQYIYLPGISVEDIQNNTYNLYKRLRLVGWSLDDRDELYLAICYYTYKEMVLVPTLPNYETFFNNNEFIDLISETAWFHQSSTNLNDWYLYTKMEKMDWTDKYEGTFIYNGFQQNRSACFWMRHSTDDVWEGDGYLYYTVMRGYGIYSDHMGFIAPRFYGYGNFFTVAQQNQDCKIDLTVSDYAGRWDDPLGVSTQTYVLRHATLDLASSPPVPFYTGKDYKNQWFLSGFKLFFASNKEFSVYSKTVEVYDSLTDVLLFSRTILADEWFYKIQDTDGLAWDTEYYFRAFYTDVCGRVGNKSPKKHFTTREKPLINSVTISDEQFPEIIINASMYDSLAKKITIYFKQLGVIKAYSITLDPYNYLDEFTIRFRPIEFDGQLTADTYDYTVEITNEYDRVGSKTGIKVFTFALPAAPLATYALGKGSTTITMNKSCNIYRDNILLVEATDLTYKDIDCILGNAHEYKVVYYDGVAESLPVTLNTTAYEWGNPSHYALCSEDLDMWLKKEVGMTVSPSTSINWLRIYEEIQINEQRDDITIEMEMEESDYVTFRDTFEDVTYYFKFGTYSIGLKFLSSVGKWRKNKQLYDVFMTGVRL